MTISLRLASSAVCVLALSACNRDPFGPDDSVDLVVTSFDGSGYSSHAYFTVGHQDTLIAQASTGPWPWGRTKYHSYTDAAAFQYSSTESRVVTVNARGVITVMSVGEAELTASIEGITSQPIRVMVSPAASSLLATPSSIEARVGDTIAISITALDRDGQSVPGVIFNVGLDTTYWAITSVPKEGTWNLRTPLVLHLAAKIVGRVRIIATAQNERSKARFQAAIPVAVVP